ncbi:hypothetical protein J5I95_14225 [Candidatus Poribacteria bacterium]|nr:hypothetical protein [Candidatus Poribacteria bacterium]
MLFFKKHAWLLVSIVVGLCISALILSRSSDPPISEDELVPSGEADLRSSRFVPSVFQPPPLPPPLGETEDTGYWDGNTWHQKPAPKPKKKWFWERELTLEDFIDHEITAEFLETVIRNQPYSEAAILARIFSGGVEDLKSALKYHPESPILHAVIADEMQYAGNEGKSGMFHEYSPEEAVAFAEKALRLSQNNSTENLDAYIRAIALNSSTVEMAHKTLGITYQYLGDYDAALYHLKAGQRLFEPAGYDPFGEELAANVYANNIAAIEAGTPVHKPKPKPSPEAFTSRGALPSASAVDFPEGVSLSDPLYLPDPVERPGSSKGDDAVLSDRELRARSVAEEAHAAFMRSVPDVHEQQQAFDDFLRGLQLIEHQQSSPAVDTVLMRELSKHLSGSDTAFTPQELMGAFSAVRHRQKRGHRQLEKLDADRDREMDHQHRSLPPTAP